MTLINGQMPTEREDALTTAVVDLAVESWRLLQTIERVAPQLDADQLRRLSGRVNFFQKRLTESLESVSIKVVRLEGTRFGPELAVSAVNAGDFGPDVRLIVDQTLEPVVLGPDGLLRTGTVTVRREEP